MATLSTIHTPTCACPAACGALPAFDTHGLVARRKAGNVLRANVAHVVLHSPTGIECGYAGSGPADLALSALVALLPAPSADEEAAALAHPDRLERQAAWADPSRRADVVGPQRVRVSRLALALYQRFKDTFVACMAPEGGQVPIAAMRRWVAGEVARAGYECRGVAWLSPPENTGRSRYSAAIGESS